MHASVVYGDALYLVGGSSCGNNSRGDTRRPSPVPLKKLHRLDLKSFRWSVVETKENKKGGYRYPPPRDGPSCCVYKGKMYLFGGDGNDGYFNDLWSFDFETDKWALLSPATPPPLSTMPESTPSHRSQHAMWACQDKVYVFGGEFHPPDRPLLGGTRTLRNLESFDLASKHWTKLRCVGDDPWKLQETCCIPMYGAADNNLDEPSSIILWGGE